MRRSAFVVVALTSAIVACSSGADDATVATAADISTTVGDAPQDIADAGDADDPGAAQSVPDLDAEALPMWSVEIDVTATDGAGSSAGGTTTLEFDPADPGDPFGAAASCSGLRDEVGAYSLFVSGGDEVPYVGVWTADAATAGGTYDAQMRVETAAADYDAFGTLTLTDDLQSGQFLGFGPEGGEIGGTFRCTGAEPPRPLELGAADGALDSVDVFVLLRRDRAIRVVGLATTQTQLASCPAVVAGEDGGGPLVSVRGGPGIGSITAFTVTDDSLDLRVGAVDFRFDTIELTRLDGAASIAAMAPDGTSVDAAYRCT